MRVNRIFFMLTLAGLMVGLLLMFAPVTPATASSFDFQGEVLTPGQVMRALHQYGLPKIMLRERRPASIGYHYRIVFGNNRYIVMGSADTALYVYWRAAQETVEVIQRGH